MEKPQGLVGKSVKFEMDERPTPPADALVVDLYGYEGPLDILLTLARDQKVDLLQLSILDLAEQYLLFIEERQKLQLEIAADYLVMAAWLAYLKSKLLIPHNEEDGPSGAEMAERLAFQLKKLEAMRNAADKLTQGIITGQNRLTRAQAEGVTVIRRSKYECSLRSLLKAYADHEDRKGIRNPIRLMRDAVFTVEAALQRLEDMLGKLPQWTELKTYLPVGLKDSFSIRSAEASTLLASLQMVKEGHAELQQSEAFGPIRIRPRKEGPEE